MQAEELDQMFDDGEEVLEYFDLTMMKRPGLAMKQVALDLPQWMMDAVDREAQRLGIQPQAVIKLWIAKRLNAVDSEDKLDYVPSHHKIKS
ncbi:MAG: BrnA antitoxin family protein [Oculatellaceae cyanobacterium Prado106]|jgi:hypothetical protein|nr:BrnA antitoxin family protein [Oculatellaceae cyanobacterium Prado106]